MGQEPDQIRQQIAHTREEMGETIDALGYKADLPARAKDKVTGTVERARDSVAGGVDSLKGAVSGTTAAARDAAPNSGDVAAGARQAAGIAQRNPIGLAVGSVAVGFLAGMMVPATRVEDERIGPVADDVKEHAADLGHEAVEQGKQVAKEAAETAAASVGESAAQHAEELRASAQEHVASVAGSADGHDAPQGNPAGRSPEA
jgi:hypothetical protein